VLRFVTSCLGLIPDAVTAATASTIIVYLMNIRTEDIKQSIVFHGLFLSNF
jgi:hypothetical protein